MTKNMKLDDTFTVAELITVLDSAREDLKAEIKEIENEEHFDINDIEELTDRLKALTVVHNVYELFDGLVARIAQGLEKLREEETLAK